MNPSLSWDVISDVSGLFTYSFMVNALEAGTIVAVMSALVGWFMVVRRQSFAGHTLSVLAFPGAAAAALAGVSIASGYYVACGLGALAIARVPRLGRGAYSAESAAIGTVQAVGLALGFVLLSLYGGILADLEDLLFGNFLGITSGQVLTLLIVAAGVVCLLGAVGRPLLFASVDPEVARARGVPVAALSVGFLVLLAFAVAATSQITGVLLVFALLVAPPAAAQALTTRPAASLVLSVVLALVTVWLGLGIAYYSPYPVGFWITTIGFGLYALARAWAWRRKRA